MADKLHLKVFLNYTVDLDSLWRKICFYPGTHLGGEANYYIVEFNGPIADGLAVLNDCLSACDSGKFYADYGP